MIRRLSAATAVACVPVLASAQYFNIDLDVDGVVPDADFPGAAHQLGHWNDRFACDPIGEPLQDLQGQETDVMLTFAHEDGGFGYGCSWGADDNNTGGFAALLNDALSIGTILQGGKYSFTFTGLDPGSYAIFTYGVDPGPEPIYTPVYVVGAKGPNPQVVRGPMPGNAFIYGVTHVRHFVDVTDGTLRVVIDSPPNNLGAEVNGFQLAPVPAPSAFGVLGLGLVARRRRR